MAGASSYIIIKTDPSNKMVMFFYEWTENVTYPSLNVMAKSSQSNNTIVNYVSRNEFNIGNLNVRIDKNNYIEVKDKDASKIYYKINENK